MIIFNCIIYLSLVRLQVEVLLLCAYGSACTVFEGKTVVTGGFSRSDSFMLNQ